MSVCSVHRSMWRSARVCASQTFHTSGGIRPRQAPKRAWCRHGQFAYFLRQVCRACTLLQRPSNNDVPTSRPLPTFLSGMCTLAHIADFFSLYPYGGGLRLSSGQPDGWRMGGCRVDIIVSLSSISSFEENMNSMQSMQNRL